MARAHREWTVLEHGPIEQLADNLWRVQGSLPGMSLRRVMTVARRRDGDLVIHNGIALEEPLMAEIEAFGPPRYLIVPNGYHRLDAPAYANRYPDARVLCPRAARKKVEQVVPVGGDYGDFPDDEDVSLQHAAGTADREGIMTVRSPDGVTLVFNDLLFNMPDQKGFAGFVFRHLTQSTGGPRVSRIARWFLVKDLAAFRGELERLAATPELRRIIVSHHRTIDDDAGATLARVASSLG